MTRPERLPAYDERALRELSQWKNPKPGLLGRTGDSIERLIETLTDWVPLGQVEKALDWVLPRMRDVTWRATSRRLVIRAYQRGGESIVSTGEIANLELQTADAAAGDRRAHEAAVAGAEGAAAGFFGGWALAADIAGVMLLSMRAVQSRALVYGFEPTTEEELAFVLHVLDAATRLGPNSKRAARAGISTVGTRMTEAAITAEAIDQVLQRLPKQLAARMGAMKAESIAPIVGSFTSASFNAWYLQAVTHTARTAYRERFLRRRYGDDLLSAYGL